MLKQKPISSTQIRFSASPGKITTTLLIFLYICLSLSACGRNDPDPAHPNTPKDLRDSLVKNPTKISSFQLTDQNGNNFTNKQLEGKWTFVFFGYSHCPDVCPTSLMEMDDLSKLISAPNNNIQYVFVTVDPKRDTVEHLKNYITYFNNTFTALTGSMDAIHKLATEADIFHNIEQITKTEYLVEHSSALVLINPSAHYYARFEAPLYASDIQTTFEKIRQFYIGKQP